MTERHVSHIDSRLLARRVWPERTDAEKAEIREENARLLREALDDNGRAFWAAMFRATSHAKLVAYDTKRTDIAHPSKRASAGGDQ